jgi:hypothetical protein
LFPSVATIAFSRWYGIYKNPVSEAEGYLPSPESFSPKGLNSVFNTDHVSRPRGKISSIYNDKIGSLCCYFYKIIIEHFDSEL